MYNLMVEAYDEIFPITEKRKKFLNRLIENNTKVLDVGCSTGKDSNYLANKKNCTVRALDFDSDMIKFAKSHVKNVDFKTINMMNIGIEYKDINFNYIICLGNTIVHLKEEELKEFLLQIREKLILNGKFIIQFLNYDKIKNKMIKELPIINTTNYIFKRKYEFLDDGSIKFITSLERKHTNDTNDINDNELGNVLLYPIYTNKINEISTSLGFSIQHYGDFDFTEFDMENSYFHIVTLTKI